MPEGLESYSPPQELRPDDEKADSFEFKIIEEKVLQQELRDKTDELMRRIEDEKIDSLIFLDKSARPISWLLRDVWHNTKPSERLPDIKFCNIGSGHSAVSESRRAIYEDQTTEQPESASQSIAETAEQLKEVFGTEFKDKNVLIVDEYSDTGATEKTALAAAKQAFPQAERINSTHLFDQQNDLGLVRLPWSDSKYFGATGVSDVAEQILVESLAEMVPEDREKRRTELIDKARRTCLEYYGNEDGASEALYKQYIAYLDVGFSSNGEEKLNQLIDMPNLPENLRPGMTRLAEMLERHHNELKACHQYDKYEDFFADAISLGRIGYCAADMYDQIRQTLREGKAEGWKELQEAEHILAGMTVTGNIPKGPWEVLTAGLDPKEKWEFKLLVLMNDSEGFISQAKENFKQLREEMKKISTLTPSNKE